MSDGETTLTTYEIEVWEDYLGSMQWRRVAMSGFATQAEADAFRTKTSGPVSRMTTRTVRVTQIRRPLS